MADTPKPGNGLILWYGSTDLIWMLQNIGKMHVDHPNTIKHVEAILYCGDKGLITIREHFAERFPLGVKAYEVTDKGIALIEEYAGETAAIEVIEDREFYRKNSTQQAYQARVEAERIAAAVKAQPFI